MQHDEEREETSMLHHRFFVRPTSESSDERDKLDGEEREMGVWWGDSGGASTWMVECTTPCTYSLSIIQYSHHHHHQPARHGPASLYHAAQQLEQGTRLPGEDCRTYTRTHYSISTVTSYNDLLPPTCCCLSECRVYLTWARAEAE